MSTIGSAEVAPPISDRMLWPGAASPFQKEPIHAALEALPYAHAIALAAPSVINHMMPASDDGQVTGRWRDWFRVERVKFQISLFSHYICKIFYFTGSRISGNLGSFHSQETDHFFRYHVYILWYLLYSVAKSTSKLRLISSISECVRCSL